MWSEQQPVVEHTQNCGDDSCGLQEEPPNTAPPHHSEQHCVCCGVLHVSGIHNLPGPKVGVQHRHSQEKGPAEDVLPAPAQEVQPASGAADPILHRHYSVCSLHIHHCVVWIGHQTG